MGTALSRSQSQLDLVKKAESYNVAAQSVDGMNVLEVIDKTQVALDYIKREQRPCFIEYKTYRFRPHSMFDPELYRKKEEVSIWKERDPINFLKAYMLDQKLLSEIVFQDLTKKVEQEMQEAVAFAEAGTLEPVEDLEKYVYENDL
jgi:pyruvate dehydrogenase E1 component alpha subunit